MKRERNAKKQDSKNKGSNSQLKVNETAQNVMCKVCRQTFMKTVKTPELQKHVETKHAQKALKDCFDDIKE